MLIFDINDIMFFINSLKTPTSAFDIRNFIHFATGDTRLAKSHKLQHAISSTNLSSNFRICHGYTLCPENVLHAFMFSQAPPT